MPYYEYQGKTYEIATDDPATAKAKILAHLGSSKIEEGTGEEFGAGELAQMAAPAGMPTQTIIQPSGFAKYPPTGVGRIVSDVAVPAGEYAVGAIKPVLSGYKSSPVITGAVDLASAALTGIPAMSGVRSVMGMHERFKTGLEKAKAAAENVQKTASSSDIVPYEKTGTLMYESQPVYKDVWKQLNQVDPALAKRLSDITNGPGGATAAAQYLQSPEIQGVMSGNAEFAKNTAEFVKKVPTTRTQQAMQLIKPFGRAAARVAGPVAMGMDIYDASQFAHESNLGPRLAAGQGRSAQQAFRNMPINQQYGGLTAEEQAILEQDRIDQAIRRKAASKVLGPIAPGQ